jgi:hypothetical protein
VVLKFNSLRPDPGFLNNGRNSLSITVVLTLADARKRSKALLKDIATERGKARPAAAHKPSARKA